MKKKFYHATKLENMKSILECGLHPRFGNEVYFTSNPISAINWVGQGKPGHYAVIQVELTKNQYSPGMDHHPIMELLYPGEVVVVNKPVYDFSAVLVYEKTDDAVKLDHIVGYKHTIKGKPKAPWSKTSTQEVQEYHDMIEEVRNFLKKTEQ